ncbi:MAG: hypothetical protein V4679_06120 [Pseudomonadota bacterium]
MIAVVKIRASAHSHEMRLFRIDDEGLDIEDRMDGYEGLLGAGPTRQSGQRLNAIQGAS